MNQKIEFQKNLKKKLGVTMTTHMGVNEVIEAFNRVSPAIKSTLPINISLMIESAQNTIKIAQNTRLLYTRSVKIYKTCQDAIETYSAAKAGQLQQPQIKLAVVTAKLAETKQDDVVYELGNKLLDSIS